MASKLLELKGNPSKTQLKKIYRLTNVSISYKLDYIFEQTKTSLIQFTNFDQRHDNKSFGLFLMLFSLLKLKNICPAHIQSLDFRFKIIQIRWKLERLNFPKYYPKYERLVILTSIAYRTKKDQFHFLFIFFFSLKI